MKDLFKMVEEFHFLSGQPVLSVPFIPTVERVLLRERLMTEELEETFIAADNGDIVGVFDGLLDESFVTIGTALEFGISWECFVEGFIEVSRSNMSKSCATKAEAIAEAGSLSIDKNCEVIVEERNGRYILIRKSDNKILKPSTYSEANLAPILAKYKNG